MSRHYNPYSLEPDPHPLRRSWQAAIGRVKLAAAWLLLRMTQTLNRLLRLGARPNAATILEIQNAQRSLPEAQELKRELKAVPPRMADTDRTRHAFDRRPAQLEN
jgi:hypothetical protein